MGWEKAKTIKWKEIFPSFIISRRPLSQHSTIQHANNSTMSIAELLHERDQIKLCGGGVWEIAQTQNGHINCGKILRANFSWLLFSLISDERIGCGCLCDWTGPWDFVPIDSRKISRVDCIFLIPFRIKKASELCFQKTVRKDCNDSGSLWSSNN
jgi:hypothetical protein